MQCTQGNVADTACGDEVLEQPARPAQARAECNCRRCRAPLGVLTAFDIHRAEQLGVVGRVHQERADHDPQLVKRIGQGGIERGGQQVNERLEGPIDGGTPGN
jgi:hypothetical protein